MHNNKLINKGKIKEIESLSKLDIKNLKNKYKDKQNYKHNKNILNNGQKNIKIKSRALAYNQGNTSVKSRALAYNQGNTSVKSRASAYNQGNISIKLKNNTNKIKIQSPKLQFKNLINQNKNHTKYISKYTKNIKKINKKLQPKLISRNNQSLNFNSKKYTQGSIKCKYNNKNYNRPLIKCKYNNRKYLKSISKYNENNTRSIFKCNYNNKNYYKPLIKCNYNNKNYYKPLIKCNYNNKNYYKPLIKYKEPSQILKKMPDNDYLENNENIENLELDIYTFIKKSFAILNRNAKFLDNWHIELIAKYLYSVYTGENKRLIINIPPRCLKSISISIAWPAWLLAQNPALRIIIIGYSQILSNRNFNDIFLILESTWYQENFPNVQIKKKIKNRITTSENGFIYATSTNGTLTGEGGDIFIIDDPHNPMHIHSIKMQNNVINWFEQVLYSRLNDPSDGKILLVMQRLHMNDLSGHLSKNSDWTILKLPIIAPGNKTYNISDFKHQYKKGNILHSTRFSTIILRKIKENLGNYNWQAQYMQAPIPKKGIIEHDMIIRENLQNIEFDYIIQSWDTAIKINSNSDFSACVTFGILDDKYYIIDIYQERLTYPALKKKCIEYLYKFKPYKILIEDKSSGQSLIQDLNMLRVNNIVPIKPKFDKRMRLALNLEYFIYRKIIFSSNINQHYIDELLIFPYGKHDDIVDCISQFLDFIKIKKMNSSIFIV